MFQARQALLEAREELVIISAVRRAQEHDRQLRLLGGRRLGKDVVHGLVQCLVQRGARAHGGEPQGGLGLRAVAAGARACAERGPGGGKVFQAPPAGDGEDREEEGGVGCWCAGRMPGTSDRVSFTP